MDKLPRYFEAIESSGVMAAALSAIDKIRKMEEEEQAAKKGSWAHEDGILRGRHLHEKQDEINDTHPCGIKLLLCSLMAIA